MRRIAAMILVFATAQFQSHSADARADAEFLSPDAAPTVEKPGPRGEAIEIAPYEGLPTPQSPATPATPGNALPAPERRSLAVPPAATMEEVQPLAEIVELPPLPPVAKPKPAPAPKAPLTRSEPHASEKIVGGSPLTRPVKAPDAASQPVAARAADKGSAKAPPSLVAPGYPTVLTGGLGADLELGPAQSPILIRGNFAIPAGRVLRLKAGAVVHLQPDPGAQKPAQAGAPDPTRGAVVWVWGALLAEGVTGNPVEIAGGGKDESALLLYGAAACKVEGARFKNVAIAQNGGVCVWTNCEFLDVRHYALAAGACMLTHCTFKNASGIFAAYNAGPWSLLARKNLFESCREGIVLGSDPGEERLVVERNHFIHMRGAHLRVMPPMTPGGAQDGGTARQDLDLLIGENWYGTAAPEDVDLRIVDRRSDATLRARLNIRPPAAQPYKDVGAGLPASVIAASLKEQQALQTSVLRAHTAAVQKWAPAKPEKSQTAAGIRRSQDGRAGEAME